MNKRWDLILVAVVVAGWWVAVTPSSAYFIQSDTSAQNYVALAWTQGCWEYITEKFLPVLLLTPLFKIFGATPAFEILLLAVNSALSAVLFYELVLQVSRSHRAGWLSLSLLLALPAFQFFAHTYLAYALPCLLGGWLAYRHKRWALVGLSFSFALLAHFNSLVFVGISGVLMLGLNWRELKWADFLRLLSSALLPVALLEMLFFLYNGIPFQWTRGIYSLLFKFSGVTASTATPDVLWLPRTALDSNGLLLTVVLALALIAPFIFRAQKFAFTFSVAVLGIILFYLLQSSLGRSLVLPRLLATIYPLMALWAGIVLFELSQRFRFKTQLWASLLVIFVFNFSQTTLFMRDFLQTLYPPVETWFTYAAQKHMPVKYLGNPWAGLFFAQRSGVEVLVGEAQWVQANNPEGALLIIMGEPAPTLRRSDGYTVHSYDLVSNLNTVYPALTFEAAVARHLEVWEPAQPARKLAVLAPLTSASASYYSGKGCLTAPPFSGGTQYYYQLLLAKIGLR